MEEKYKEFKEAVLKCATVVCGCRWEGQGIRKMSEWWNGKVRIAVLRKRMVFEQ